jgi:hypothetical protein
MTRGTRVMKLSILSAVILISISAGKAFGCVCVLDPNPTPEKIRADRLKAFENASAVFTGEVVSLDLITVKFKVNKIWKGEASPEISMLTGARDNGDGTFTVTSCDYSFTKDQRYLVYAYGPPGEMKTHQCSRTALIKYADQEMQGLDEIIAPVKMKEEPAISDPSTTHKITITFTGSVKSIDVLGGRELKAVPVDLDSRFAITVHIEAVTPEDVPLEVDTDQNFAIHSPAQLFGDEKENVIGRKYRFKVVWNGIRTHSKFYELSAVPIVDEATRRN